MKSTQRGEPQRRAAIGDLADESRLWVFGADRPLSKEEGSLLAEATQRFLDGWAAHGEGLTAAFEWVHDRFLIVAVDEHQAAASGCSIDALMNHARELERELAVDLVDSSPVWYRTGAEIRRVGRSAFQELAERGEVGIETVVFDLTVQRLGELRAGRWELPAGSSWHARLLPTPSG